MDTNPVPLAEQPIVLAKTIIPPALLDDIAEDPEKSRDYFRRVATIHYHELHLARQTLTPQQRLQLAEAYAKLGGLEPKKTEATSAATEGYRLVINIGNHTDTVKGVTVDATPTQIEVDDASV